MIDATKPFPALDDRALRPRRAEYHPHLRALRHHPHSGVYAIIDTKTRAVLYVGESHTGRLYDTITRHFRQWAHPWRDAQGRTRGGTTYNRHNVLIAYTITTDAQAQDMQFAEIQRLQPRDNMLDGSTVCCDDLPT